MEETVVARRRGAGGGAVDAKPMDIAFGLGTGVGLCLGVGSSAGGAGFGSGPSVGSGSGASGGGSGAGGLGQEGRDGQGVGEESSDEIRCRCGSSLDDGFSIACDVCGWWCHAACFAISKESELVCWMCAPRKHPQFDTLPANGHPPTSRAAAARPYRCVTATPPSGARSSRTPSSTILKTSGRNTSPSTRTLPRTQPHSTSSARTPPNGGASPRSSPCCPCTRSDTDMDTPSSSSARLRQHTPPPSTPASLHSIGIRLERPPRPTRLLPPPHLRPPCACPAPPRTLLARYPALITPSSHYLAQAANGYAHAGAPERFVHLVGLPLDLALDARGAGGRGRWFRSGCWPNAEMRA
ncbi:hypothetical protein K438DRAFT_958861 [Mycena galopus ATCC 62051]|nr:hypothetical protein K438DRAFT_958861 [Mycena galopus ATCC 62051]